MLSMKVIGENSKPLAHLVSKKHGLLTSHQCEYKRYHSTTNQLFYLENAAQNQFMEDKHMDTVFFDL